MQLNLQDAFLNVVFCSRQHRTRQSGQGAQDRGPADYERTARCIAILDYHTYRVQRGLSMNSFTGVIQGKVDETQLKAMLEQINEKTEQKVKVLPRALHTSHFSTCYLRRLPLLAA
jgi:hypothetical protein